MTHTVLIGLALCGVAVALYVILERFYPKDIAALEQDYEILLENTRKHIMDAKALAAELRVDAEFLVKKAEQWEETGVARAESLLKKLESKL